MPLTAQQATSKQAVFDEIKAQYPGAGVPRNWSIAKFRWEGPSDIFVQTAKPLERLKLELKHERGTLSVRLVKPDLSYCKVGTIDE